MSEEKKQIKEVVAQLRYLRQSSRKVRLVAQSVVKLPVERALAALDFVPKAASLPLAKLIRSAMANAKHNFNLAEEGLYIKAFMVDQGPALKRFRPAAFGMAHPIKKHTCHIKLVLGILENQGKKQTKAEKNDKKAEVKAAKKSATEKTSSIKKSRTTKKVTEKSEK